MKQLKVIIQNRLIIAEPPYIFALVIALINQTEKLSFWETATFYYVKHYKNV